MSERYGPQPWADYVGLPDRSERTWITLSEMTEELGREGIRVTREIAAKAVVGDKPEKFRFWSCYEPRHVDAVRKLASGLRTPRKRSRASGKR